MGPQSEQRNPDQIFFTSQKREKKMKKNLHTDTRDELRAPHTHHCGQAGDVFHRVLHLLLRHLDQYTTVVIFRRKRLSAMPCHPWVYLDSGDRSRRLGVFMTPETHSPQLQVNDKKVGVSDAHGVLRV